MSLSSAVLDLVVRVSAEVKAINSRTSAAGGDLAGTYPDPTLAKIKGLTISAVVPKYKQVLTVSNTTSTAVNWQTPLGRPHVDQATTGNIVLADTQMIDGSNTNPGSRYLVWKQTDKTENGIWIAAVGPWTRSTDGTSTTIPGALISVMTGPTYGGKVFTTNFAPDFGTVGVDPMNWFEVLNTGSTIDASQISGLVVVPVNTNVQTLLLTGAAVQYDPNLSRRMDITTCTTATQITLVNPVPPAAGKCLPVVTMLVRTPAATTPGAITWVNLTGGSSIPLPVANQIVAVSLEWVDETVGWLVVGVRA